MEVSSPRSYKAKPRIMVGWGLTFNCKRTVLVDFRFRLKFGLLHIK